MAKKKLDLVPFDQIAKQQQLTFSLPDLFPSYADEGTSFTGYSKKLIGKGTYKLLKQLGTGMSGKTNYSSSSGTSNFTGTAITSNVYYMKRLIISYSANNAAVGNYAIPVSFKYLNSSNIFFSINIPVTTSNVIYIEFDDPIPLSYATTGQIGFTMTTTANMTGFIEANFIGWREEQ